VGPKGKQRSEKSTTANNEDRYAPERHETDESMQKQPLVNEEKQNKIVNEQNDLSDEKETNRNSKSNLQDKDGDIGEKVPAMD
jgi:hypothetical protein